jgi:hypothetical protein
MSRPDAMVPPVCGTRTNELHQEKHSHPVILYPRYICLPACTLVGPPASRAATVCYWIGASGVAQAMTIYSPRPSTLTSTSTSTSTTNFGLDFDLDLNHRMRPATFDPRHVVACLSMGSGTGLRNIPNPAVNTSGPPPASFACGDNTHFPGVRAIPGRSRPRRGWRCRPRRLGAMRGG